MKIGRSKDKERYINIYILCICINIIIFFIVCKIRLVNEGKWCDVIMYLMFK